MTAAVRRRILVRGDQYEAEDDLERMSGPLFSSDCVSAYSGEVGHRFADRNMRPYKEISSTFRFGRNGTSSRTLIDSV